MIYLYGLLEPSGLVDGSCLSDVQGLGGAPNVSSVGRWWLIWGEHDGSEIMPRRRNMLAHTRVVEQAMVLGAVLPGRFGLMAESVEEVERLVALQEAAIKAEFERVDGCAEYGLRVRFDKDASLAAALDSEPRLQAERDRLLGRGAEAHFERAEFGRRLAEHMDRRRGLAQKDLLARLQPYARDHVLRAPEDDAEILRAEFLIARTAEERFFETVEEITHAHEFAGGGEPVVQIIGPVPMYNFVHLSLAFNETDEAA